MAINTTATGSTIDGVTVVHPDNIGSRLVWNNETKQYDVKIEDIIERLSSLEGVLNNGVISNFLKRNILIGMLFPYLGNTIPDGYIVAEGQKIDPITQPILHSIYGEYMPDTRAAFLRGLDNGKGIDVGRTLGSLQKGSAIGYDPTADVKNVVGVYNSVVEDMDAAFSRAGYDKPELAGNYDGLYLAAISDENARVNSFSDGERSFRIGIARPLNIACRYICLNG